MSQADKAVNMKRKAVLSVSCEPGEMEERAEKHKVEGREPKMHSIY